MEGTKSTRTSCTKRFIPNYDNNDTTELEDGQVVAIEVFMTDGMGMVQDTEDVQIFQKYAPAVARSEQTRKISNFIDAKYKTFPFAMRWLVKEFNSEFAVRRAIGDLGALGVLRLILCSWRRRRAWWPNSRRR